MGRGRGKNTEYFLSLEKNRHAKKSINKLMTKTGEVTVDQSEILDVSKEYYKSLYKSTCPET